jgi:hypothetical protein
MGKQLEYQKKAVGVRGKEKLYQNDTTSTSTRQTIAQQHRVGEATVARNMRFARNVDAIAAAAGEDARTAILARDVKMTPLQPLRLKALRFVTGYMSLVLSL